MNASDRSVVGFAMLAHATFHVYELAIPVFITVWLDTFGVSEATLGVVVSVGYALVGLGALPSGVLADAYGSRTLVLASSAGMGGGFLLVGLAPNVAVLALALVVWGASASLYHPAGLSLLSRGIDDRGSALAYHGMAGNVGTVAGPLAATTLLVAFSWRVAAGLFVVPAVVATLVGVTREITPPTGDESDTTAPDGGGRSLGDLADDASALFRGGFLVVFAVVVLYGLYYRGVLTFLPEILGGLGTLEPVSAFGRSFEPSRYVYAGLLLVGVFGQYGGGKLSDVVAPERALVATFAAMFVAAVSFVPASEAGLVPLLAVCGLLGVFVYAAAPIYQATVADYVPTDSHGLSYGFTYLAMFGIGAAGAGAAGVALTYGNPAALFAGLAVLAAVAATLAAVLSTRIKE